jgi:hypothetical protein
MDLRQAILVNDRTQYQTFKFIGPLVAEGAGGQKNGELYRTNELECLIINQFAGEYCVRSLGCGKPKILFDFLPLPLKQHRALY